MADKIVVMRAGKIEQIGSPDEVYDTPASKYVADFIGSAAINFMPGTVVTGEGQPAVDTPNGRIRILPGAAVKPGQKVICGIRPTDAVVSDDGPIRTKALLVERMDHDVQLCTAAPAGQFLAIVDRSRPFAEGVEVRFDAAPEKVHVFDAETEMRL